MTCIYLYHKYLTLNIFSRMDVCAWLPGHKENQCQRRRIANLNVVVAIGASSCLTKWPISRKFMEVERHVLLNLHQFTSAPDLTWDWTLSLWNMQIFCIGPAHNFWFVFNYTKEGNKLCVLAKFSWLFWFGVLQGVVNALKRLWDSWMKGVMKEVYCYCFRGGIMLLGKPLSLETCWTRLFWLGYDSFLS